LFSAISHGRNYCLEGIFIGGGNSMKSLEGQKAPAFTLEGSDGKKHSLEDYKGKTVVMFFYPKDSTPG
jgi:peroxiredoxin